MKMINKKMLASAVAASAFALSAVSPVASAAEVSASVGAANMYYWRGMDLGSGDAAISGDINVSASGAYAGLWTSSGDAALGTEYDIYAGYGNSFGDFSFDISAWSYVYPTTRDNPETMGDEEIGPGDLVEVVASAGYGPVNVTYYDNVEGDDGYWYATGSVSVGSFSFLYGQHEDDYSHVDLSYAYNDNLSFTLGVPVDDVDGAYDDSVNFVVGLTLPIEF